MVEMLLWMAVSEGGLVLQEEMFKWW